MVLGACLLAGGAAGVAHATAPLARLSPPLSTPWTAGISRTAPLAEYPRPQLTRPDWENLNGQWQYETSPHRSSPPFGRDLAQTILVPFPVQSALSGIARGDTVGWYRRTFTIPSAWRHRHVVLNFGAVSWASTVWVNRRLVGTHRGDYDAFSLDITRALSRRGPNELVVGYVNPVGGGGEPVGKQALGPPSSILHSANSGIWQTVWLEPVSSSRITALKLTPELPHSRLRVDPTLLTDQRGVTLQAQARAGPRLVASGQVPAGRSLNLEIPHPQLWSPDHPYLYTLQLQLLDRHRRVLDRVASYFGMRSITLGRLGGQTRILLNGHFLFQTGGLDQGYWPDGQYTAPDAALRADVLTAKTLGYNMLREHEKVQPDRWYMWADRLGLLVWQDMPSMPLINPHPPSAAARSEFRQELSRIIIQLRSHPSIVTWVPFNEGWQQFDLDGITRAVRTLDPSALVDSQSGGANCCAAQESRLSDIRDTHLYTGPFAVAPDSRASAIGEYGGILPFPPRGHRWPGTLYSIGSPAVEWPVSDSSAAVEAQYAMLASEARHGGLSAAIFTEFGAYEQELGIVAYDRRAFSLNPRFVARLNGQLIAAAVSAPARGREKVPPASSGFWPLNEGRGSAVPNLVSPAHPLLLANRSGWTRGPHGRPALILRGAGAAAATLAPVIDTARSFTVSAWLRSDQVGQSASGVSQLSAPGSGFSLGIETQRGRQAAAVPGQWSSGIAPPALRSSWSLLTPNGASCAIAACAVRANLHYGDGRIGVGTGVWRYVTGVFDAGRRTVSVYVDGQPQDLEHTPGLPPGTGPLIVGAGTAVYAAQDSLRGAITQLRTYARALTPAEIWQLYRAESR